MDGDEICVSGWSWSEMKKCMGHVVLCWGDITVVFENGVGVKCGGIMYLMMSGSVTWSEIVWRNDRNGCGMGWVWNEKQAMCLMMKWWERLWKDESGGVCMGVEGRMKCIG